jgi:hypothetical protein
MQDLLGFREIPKFKGRYFISDYGKVVSIDKKGSIKSLKPNKHRNGHLRVKLKGKDYPIHRLVLESWVGKAPTKKHICRHLNDIHADNRVENLCWGTLLDNAKDVQDNKIKKTNIINRMRESGFTPDEISIIARIPLLELAKIG